MFAFIQSLIRPVTFSELVTHYLASPAFLTLSHSSQAPYRRTCARLALAFGSRPVRSLTRAEVESLLARRTPGAATDDLKKLRVLFAFGMARGHVRGDPTRGIKRCPAGPGHHTWTESELARFEARWPLGTRERLAFALLLYTGQRRGDVVRMRWTDIEGGRIGVCQGKTGTRLAIPIHPALERALGQCGSGPLSGSGWQSGSRRRDCPSGA
jgi:integrase